MEKNLFWPVFGQWLVIEVEFWESLWKFGFLVFGEFDDFAKLLKVLNFLIFQSWIKTKPLWIGVWKKCPNLSNKNIFLDKSFFRF